MAWAVRAVTRSAPLHLTALYLAQRHLTAPALQRARPRSAQAVSRGRQRLAPRARQERSGRLGQPRERRSLWWLTEPMWRWVQRSAQHLAQRSGPASRQDFLAPAPAVRARPQKAARQQMSHRRSSRRCGLDLSAVGEHSASSARFRFRLIRLAHGAFQGVGET